MISQKQKSRGFTLLELLVVVAIIGLLASYVAPRYFSQVEKSEIKVARAQIDALEKALDQYRKPGQRRVRSLLLRKDGRPGGEGDAADIGNW